jgi:hypothetical protein
MMAREWDSSTHLWLMLHNAEQQTGDQRKMSLFGTGCCRRHRSFLRPESQALLDEFEDLLDRLSRPTSADVCTAGQALCHRANSVVGLVRPLNPFTYKLRLAVAKAVCYAVSGDAWGAYGYFTELDPKEEGAFVHLLRDIFGNPFRPLSINPTLRTDTAMSLARQMYDSREFSPMPILGDALEEAGCSESEILDHCRLARDHVRGCWVVDLLLDKG